MPAGNIHKTHVHSFHNKLLGELTIRIVLEPTLLCAKIALTKNFDVKTTMEEIKAMAQEI